MDTNDYKFDEYNFKIRDDGKIIVILLNQISNQLCSIESLLKRSIECKVKE